MPELDLPWIAAWGALGALCAALMVYAARKTAEPPTTPEQRSLARLRPLPKHWEPTNVVEGEEDDDAGA